MVPNVPAVPVVSTVPEKVGTFGTAFFEKFGR
jgi:hypothetical protein